MKLKTFGAIAAAGAAMMLGSVSTTIAHHSFASEFDANRPIEVEGVVKEMRFSNPHSWIYLNVTTSSGEVQEWAIEGAAPNALLRRGFSRESLPAGTEVRIVERRSPWLRVRLANGRDVWVPASSASPLKTDAPVEANAPS